MDTSDDGVIVRRRRRTHSSEFKAKVVSDCRRPGVSMAAVALANGLNANLVRRWVVSEERADPAKLTEAATAPAAAAVEQQRTFIPIELAHSRAATTQAITIELRHGATVVKVDWPLAAAAECAAWLRELLR
jgi:transposase-like protein